MPNWFRRSHCSGHSASPRMGKDLESLGLPQGREEWDFQAGRPTHGAQRCQDRLCGYVIAGKIVLKLWTQKWGVWKVTSRGDHRFPAGQIDHGGWSYPSHITFLVKGKQALSTLSVPPGSGTFARPQCLFWEASTLERAGSVNCPVTHPPRRFLPPSCDLPSLIPNA